MGKVIAGYTLKDHKGVKVPCVHFAQTQEELTAKGCIPLERAERPTDGKKYRAVYEVVDGVIRQSWEVCEPDCEEAAE